MSLKSCLQKYTKKVPPKTPILLEKRHPKKPPKSGLTPLGSTFELKSYPEARMSQKGAPKVAPKAKMDTKIAASRMKNSAEKEEN